MWGWLFIGLQLDKRIEAAKGSTHGLDDRFGGQAYIGVHVSKSRASIKRCSAFGNGYVASISVGIYVQGTGFEPV